MRLFPLLAALLLAPGLALACTLPQGADVMRAEVVALTNQQRTAKGMPPLTEDPALTQAAQDHACDMAQSQRMSHSGSDGSTLPTRMNRAGYTFGEAAENVAAGYADAASVMAGWMNSHGHRRNILDRTLRDIGVGVARGSDGMLYWTMDLGTRN